MLAIPLKKGQSSDLSKPLFDYMCETYDEGKATHFSESFTQIQMQREQFLLLFSNKKPSEGDLAFAEKYIKTLGIIESKFPVDGTTCKIDFTWYDCFSLTKKATYGSIGAEKAMALFNFAALHSRAALALKNDPGREKDLINYYKIAGSLFEYLRSEFIPHHRFGAPLSDMSPEGLMLLSNLMFAQGQVQLYQKAIQSEKAPSPKLLAALAQGIADLYKRSYDQTTTNALKGVLGASWGQHILMQHYIYAAAAEKQMAANYGSEAESTSEGYGTELAWLEKARETAQTAVNFARTNNLSSDILNGAEKLFRDLNEVWQTKDYDNKNIYLEPVPARNKLEAIKPRYVCQYSKDCLNPKWFAPHELTDELETDPFFGLMPVAIEKAVNTFEVKLRETVVGVDREITSSIENMRQLLTDANLPMMFEVSGQVSSGGVPDATFARIIAIVQERGGVNELKGMLADNQDNNMRMRKVVAELISGLQKDDENYKKYKNMYGEKWSVPPAGESGENLRKQCFKIDGFLQEGGNSDALLWQKIEEGDVAKLLHNVSLPKTEMDKLIPAPANIDEDPAVEDARVRVQTSYINLNEKLSAATKALREFKNQCEEGVMAFAEEMSKREDISSLVTNKTELNSIITAKARAFNDMALEVKSFPDQFAPLFSRVMEDSTKYMQSRTNNNVSQGQMYALQGLEKGIEEFEKAWKAITEGKAFYQTVDVRLGKLKVMVDDHLMVRNMITEELAEALKGFQQNGNANNNRGPQPGQHAPSQATTPTQQPNYYAQPYQAPVSPPYQQQYQQPMYMPPPTQMYQPPPNQMYQPPPNQYGNYAPNNGGYYAPSAPPANYGGYSYQPPPSQQVYPSNGGNQTNQGGAVNNSSNPNDPNLGRGNFMKMFKSRRGF